ncbi:MAG: lysylphosphatidylglycerol synthase transmembrane domain-containing protein [Pirellulaceae bacterium]|nr:flippase-like domain-containing protein [Planctomycetales bacterium]
MKRKAITAAKFLVPLLILAWLAYDVPRKDPEMLTRLTEQPKNWGALAAALGVCFTAICLSFVRWYLLIRALEIPFRLRDAVRLGFLAYLLNFVSLGALGGDLFKAVFVVRDCPGRRAEAVATILVDRILGLFALLLIASAATLMMMVRRPEYSDLRGFAWVCWALTAVAMVMGGLLFVPRWSVTGLVRSLERLPAVGPVLYRVEAGLSLFRRRPQLLGGAILTALGVHFLLATSVYLTARGLLPIAPSWDEHLLIWPIAGAANAIPFSPAGLGQMEEAMRQLYMRIPETPMQGQNDGLVVAFSYRLMTMAVAAVGMIFYWVSRREVRAALDEAEHVGETQHLSR